MKKRFLLITILAITALLIGCSSILPKVLPGLDNSPAGGFDVVPVTGKVCYDGLDYTDSEVLVRAVSAEILQEALDGTEGLILKEYDDMGWYLVSVPADKTPLGFIDELEAAEGIILAEPNLLWEIPPLYEDNWRDPDNGFPVAPKSGPEANDYYKLWGMKTIKADEAWDVTTGNERVIVAIIDTGLDCDHPEFESANIIGEMDMTGEGLARNDFHGHGTHVTGTAAADGRSGKLAGVVWDCSIMPIRVMDLAGRIANSWLGEGMLYVADFLTENSDDYDAAVVNMSIGGRGYSYFFKDCIDYAFEKGVLLVTAAGNDSKRVLSYPSAYNGVVSVAATTPDDVKADFSTTGSWNSVGAPGVAIWSSVPGGYGMMQGTSMASPHACGAAALLLSKEPTLTPLEVKNRLEASARPGGYGPGHSEEVGYGIIDCEALLSDDPVDMKYGSLKVETNVLITEDAPYGYGLVTVFKKSATGEIERWAYFGSTGKDGIHMFNAMLPGEYLVTLSYNGKIHAQEEVEIVAGVFDKIVELSLIPDDD